MKKPYVCAMCGNKNVKLWRPYMFVEPLICASCAEKNQVPRTYPVLKWVEKDGERVGITTGEKTTLPRWEVDKDGRIPSEQGYDEVNNSFIMTDQLQVDIHKHFPMQNIGITTLIPAILDEDGDYWGYTSAPDDALKKWKDLPTK